MDSKNFIEHISMMYRDDDSWKIKQRERQNGVHDHYVLTNERSGAIYESRSLWESYNDHICLFCEAQKYNRGLKEILEIYNQYSPVKFYPGRKKCIVEYWENRCDAWGNYDGPNVKPAKR